MRGRGIGGEEMGKAGAMGGLGLREGEMKIVSFLFLSFVLFCGMDSVLGLVNLGFGLD